MRPLHVLQVSTADFGGGAERVAWNLFHQLRERGHRSRMAVGFKRSDDPDIRFIRPRARGGPWARAWNGLAAAATGGFGKARAMPAAVRLARKLAAPGAWLDAWQGHESFRFPGTQELLDGPEGPPDLLHLHNLHGGYFDLRALPALSQRVPTLVTLQDPWLLTGHCSYTLECERWETGCGRCPHLDTYPAVRKDDTAANWERKRAIYRESRLHACAPSRWLLSKVERSILAPAVVESRVIPNAIDLEVFRPGDRRALRERFGIAPDALVLTFAANRFRKPGSWKDWATVREAVARASEKLSNVAVHLFAVGDAADPEERIGRAQVHFIGHSNDPAVVAGYLQGADIALHAALPEAENCPLVVLEALACGTPMVATAVGGVAELVLGGWPGEDPALAALNTVEPGAADGILVPGRDPARMADAITMLSSRPDLRRSMGENGAREAAARYGLARQLEAYLAWYHEILREHPLPRTAAG